MDLERERGITIKAQTAALSYKARDGQVYQLNLIDTPGHVDFAYEVSRSLAACEGALLVVDASQGVEAQTVANCYTAIEQGVEVVPVLNKIDLPSADPDARDRGDRGHHRHRRRTTRSCAAAPRPAMGIDDILEAVIARIPPPKGDPAAPLQALIIDSWFDNYVGVVMLVRVMQRDAEAEGQDPADGDRRGLQLRAGRRVHAEVGGARRRCRPARSASSSPASRNSHAAKVGDTVTLAQRPAAGALPGFKEVKPQVFAGLYPVESNEYEALRDALEKLKLNDASLHYEPEVSQALGFGFRCGFLGLLHMEIVQERLEREYDLDLITTAPTVVYQVLLRDGTRARDREPVEAARPLARRGDPRADHHGDDPRCRRTTSAR